MSGSGGPAARPGGATAAGPDPAPRQSGAETSGLPAGSGLGDRVRRAIYRPPFAAVARRLRPRAAVLLYHRVAETDPGAGDPFSQAVPPELFAEHLALLSRRYRVVAAGELAERLARGGRSSLPDGTIAVTFDDGYADNLEAAAPIAARLGVPLTVFVTVEPVLDGSAFWWDELAARRNEAPETGEGADLHARLKRLPAAERRRAVAAAGPEPSPGAALAWGRPLTAAELARLAALPGIEVGSHTLSHPSLAALPEAEQLRELAGSRARLAALAGRPVRLLAYPFGKAGDVSAATRRLARQAGYLAAFTSDAGRIVPSSPRWALPRLAVHAWPADELARRLAECFG